MCLRSGRIWLTSQGTNFGHILTLFQFRAAIGGCRCKIVQDSRQLRCNSRRQAATKVVFTLLGLWRKWKWSFQYVIEGHSVMQHLLSVEMKIGNVWAGVRPNIRRKRSRGASAHHTFHISHPLHQFCNERNFITSVLSTTLTTFCLCKRILQSLSKVLRWSKAEWLRINCPFPLSCLNRKWEGGQIKRCTFIPWQTNEGSCRASNVNSELCRCIWRI